MRLPTVRNPLTKAAANRSNKTLLTFMTFSINDQKRENITIILGLALLLYFFFIGA